jgi:phage baseplate assembly protein W
MAAPVKSTILRGLALPAVRGSGGYFASKTLEDAAWGDLLLVLFTKIGARPFRRDFGSGLIGLLFDPSTPQIAQRATFEITDAVSRGAPHIVIQDVVITRSGKSVNLTISFSLRGTPGSVTRTARLDRSLTINQVSRQ